MWGLDKGPAPPLEGLPSPYRKHLLNKGPAATSAGSPSPSSLRDATSPKVRGLGSPPSLQFSTLRPAAARGAEGAALKLHAFAKGSPFGGAGAKRLRGRGCWQEAAHLVWHCLAEAQPHRKHDLNLGSAPPLPALPSPSSLTRCHLSQSERPWQSAKFPVCTLRPAAARGAVRRCAETFRLCQGLPLWGSWTPLGGLRGRGCWRELCAFV